MRLPFIYKRYARLIPGIRSYALASALVLLLGLIITILSWYVEKQRVEVQKTRELNEQVQAYEADISGRLEIYEHILRGASGLFSASNEVTKDDWRRYIQEFESQDAYAGINGIGYAPIVSTAALPAYLDKARETITPDFKIHPAGSRQTYIPVTYYEPLNSSTEKILGFDILTEPVRSTLASKVRDSGEAGISDKLTLLTDRNTDIDSSFIMFLPMYKKDSNPTTINERRANAAGYIFATFRANNFFEQITDETILTAHSDVRVFDGDTTSHEALLYQSSGFNNADSSGLSEPITTKVYDRIWTLQFAGPINDEADNNQRATLILIGGTTLSFALAGFLFLIMLTRARALVYSKQNETQQAKDDLLSLASHQLRTPATAVKQYLGMILEGYTGKVGKKQLPALQKAYASNERQLDTINQILYVAKADAGRLSIHPVSFNLNTLVDDIVLDLTDMLEEKSQTITFERYRKKLTVKADEGSLRMVIENLISNASKYSYENANIIVKTDCKNDEVFISVIDHGVGIAPEDFDKLFKKFSRIDNELSLHVSGSGIGLYVDRVLIELHGGRIEVKSTPGEGSTFTIVIPKNGASNLTDDGP